MSSSSPGTTPNATLMNHGSIKEKTMNSTSKDKLPAIENNSPPVSPFKLKQPVFLRNICGDKFGTSPQSQNGAMLGMLYQSRCQVGILEDPLIHIHSREASKK